MRRSLLDPGPRATGTRSLYTKAPRVAELPRRRSGRGLGVTTSWR